MALVNFHADSEQRPIQEIAWSRGLRSARRNTVIPSFTLKQSEGKQSHVWESYPNRPLKCVQGVGRVEGERFGREFWKDPGKREKTPLFDRTPLFWLAQKAIRVQLWPRRLPRPHFRVNPAATGSLNSSRVSLLYFYILRNISRYFQICCASGSSQTRYEMRSNVSKLFYLHKSNNLII